MSSTIIDAILKLEARETLSAAESPASGGSGDTRTYGGYNLNATLKSDSTPAVESPPVDLSVRGSETSKDWDLTAAPPARLVSDTVDLTGKKIVGLILQADKLNGGDVTIKAGASNGYDLWGSGNEVDLKPGENLYLVINAIASGKPAVGASDKVINVTKATGDKVNFLAFFGT